ncbi:esterase FE4-like [Schistocerca gregaria]|uniref:esterase FE4-like n=1 Tax=Schistocerca gregaria TaxID=7010 RepID=UPI00211EBD30|nr:esterase FE4-like [Schistocerca gregaria]
MNCHTLAFVSVILHSCLSPCFINAQEYVTVSTQEGDLRGQIETTYTNMTMYSFKGIPYAESPVGDLRFQPPVRKAAWTGVRDALQLGSPCAQSLLGQEDCLYLNVYSPIIPSQSGALKAVVVYIHGGCFTLGSGSLSLPHYFVDNDVLFVTMNYRLGLLGFLSTGDDVVPGNMGLKDQVEALRWVQRNIAAFGGDPERVTILGQSAGGASIHYHVLSPLSKGLFKNAIAMSGSALNPWAFSKNATDRAIRFANYLGYSGQNSSDLVDFLKTVDGRTLAQDSEKALSEEDSLSLFTCVWAPSVEPDHEAAFLTEEPWRLVAEGRYNHVPYMSGVTDLELVAQIHGSLGTGSLATEEDISNLNANFEEIVACDLRLPTREEQLSGAHSVRLFYYNDSEITLQDNYTTALFDSHLFFVEGVDAVVRSMARYSSEPVYYYEYTYNDGVINQYPEGAGHGSDITNMFFSTSLDPTSYGAILRDQMTAMWANFAKYDNPTPELNSLLTEKWGTYNESSPFYLELTSPLKPRMRLFESYMNFWHSLLP